MFNIGHQTPRFYKKKKKCNIPATDRSGLFVVCDAETLRCPHSTVVDLFYVSCYDDNNVPLVLSDFSGVCVCILLEYCHLCVVGLCH